ncbi:MAG: hypothetical protein BWX74_00866 [Tenericutes bacterium ADurb.Bin087]|nr:MAG: hypothetical protein BWX74_00866 [Tenericutes bacterium ADurb.Bin087]
MAYEYVIKKEYTPVRKKLEEIIRIVQKEIRSQLTFQPSLIGSGSRKLITREIGSNKGFDFDYNLALQTLKTEKKDARTIYKIIFDAIQRISKQYNYKIEQSTSAITIKLVDHKNSKIIHSCDFAIVKDEKSSGNYFQLILKVDKTTQPNKYIWNKRPASKNYYDKLRDIEGAVLWEKLEEEYLKLKNANNDNEKKSYQLFIEAINNVYNHYDWEE